jgi:hypothetical protein
MAYCADSFTLFTEFLTQGPAEKFGVFKLVAI